MSQTSPGYSPPLIKQKTFLSTWVQKWTGSEISTYVHVRVSFEYYIRCSNECGNEFASFPHTLRYARKCSPKWKSTIRKCFLIQTPCLMCIAIGTTFAQSPCCCWVLYNKTHFNERFIFLDDLFLNPVLRSGWCHKEQCCNERRSDAKIL